MFKYDRFDKVLIAILIIILVIVLPRIQPNNLGDEYKDENGVLYALGSDAYYYLNKEKIDNFNTFIIRIFEEHRNIIPIVFCLFSALLLFLLFSIKSDGESALISIILMFSSSVVLLRTMYGSIDTDYLNILIPTVITFMYLMFRKNNWLILINSLILVYLYSYGWLGYWFILIPIICYEFYSLIKKKSVSSIILFSLLLLTFGYKLIRNIFSIILLKSNNQMYNHVAELNSISFAGIFHIIGRNIIVGFIIFIIISLGIYKLIKTKKYRDLSFIGIYFISTFLASMLGNRFILLLTIPFFYILSHGIMHFKKISNKWLYWAIILILITSSLFGSYQEAKVIKPILTDEIILELENINSSQIYSWWDYGYIYEYASGVKAVYNGGNQNNIIKQNITKALIYGIIPNNTTLVIHQNDLYKYRLISNLTTNKSYMYKQLKNSNKTIIVIYN